MEQGAHEKEKEPSLLYISKNCLIIVSFILVSTHTLFLDTCLTLVTKLVLAISTGTILLSLLVVSLLFEKKLGRQNLFTFLLRVPQIVMIGFLYYWGDKKLTFQITSFLYLQIFAGDLQFFSHLLRIIISLCCMFQGESQNILVFIKIILVNLDAVFELVAHSIMAVKARSNAERNFSFKSQVPWISMITSKRELSERQETIKTDIKLGYCEPSEVFRKRRLELDEEAYNQIQLPNIAKEQGSKQDLKAPARKSFKKGLFQANPKASKNHKLGNEEVSSVRHERRGGGVPLKVNGRFTCLSWQRQNTSIGRERIFLNEFISFSDQIILTCDSEFKVCYKNYQEDIHYRKVLSKVERYVSVSAFHSREVDDIERYFICAEKWLECDLESVEHLITIKNILKFDPIDTDIESYRGEGRVGLNKIMRSIWMLQHRLESKKDLYFDEKASSQMSKVSSFLEIDLTDYSTYRPVRCSFDLFELFQLLKAFCSLRFDNNSNLPKKLKLKFFLNSQILLNVYLPFCYDRFFMIIVLENIELKLLLGNANSKLNFSKMLICSLSHELVTPVTHLITSTSCCLTYIRKLYKRLKKHSDINQVPSELSEHDLSTVMKKSKEESLSLKDDITKLEDETRLTLSFAEGLSIFVQNLLDFGNFMKRSLVVSVESFTLHAEVFKLAHIFKGKVLKKNLRLQVNCPVIDMYTDRSKLIGALYNFMDNGIKYTTKGEVVIDVKVCEADSNYIQFEVRDTGMGISEHDLKLLTRMLENPFLETRTTKSAGIGFGFRVSQIILSYIADGSPQTSVKSEEGVGTTISFRILRASKSGSTGKYSVKNKTKKVLDISKPLIEVEYKKLCISGTNTGSTDFQPKASKRSQSPKHRKLPSQTQAAAAKYKTKSKTPTMKAHNRSIVNPNFETYARPPQQLPPISEGSSSHGQAQGGVYDTKLVIKRVDFNSHESDHQGNTIETYKGMMRKEAEPVDFQGRHLRMTIKSPGNLSRSWSSSQHLHFKGTPRGTPKNLSSFNSSYESLGAKLPHILDKDLVLGSPNKPKVALVVDDEPFIVGFLEQYLDMIGFEVYTANDGTSAIDVCTGLLAAGVKLDIVFLDYYMPRMNGDICAKILRDPKFEPVLGSTIIIGLTAHRDEMIKAQCLGAGMDSVFYKPFTFEQIKKIILEFKFCISKMSFGSEETIQLKS